MFVVYLNERFDNRVACPVFANSSKKVCNEFIKRDALNSFNKKHYDGSRLVDDWFNGYSDKEIIDALKSDYEIHNVPSDLEKALRCNFIPTFCKEL